MCWPGWPPALGCAAAAACTAPPSVAETPSVAEKCLGTRLSASFLFIVLPGSTESAGCITGSRPPPQQATKADAFQVVDLQHPARRRSSRGTSFWAIRACCRLRAVSALAHSWVSYGLLLDLWLSPCGLATAPSALEGAGAALILSRLSASAVALAEPAPFLLPVMCLLAAPSVLWICLAVVVLGLVMILLRR